MNKTTVFVLGLIGSVLGMLGTLIWMYFGSFFFAGMIDHDLPLDAPLTDTALFGGLFIAGFQSLITFPLFIMALVKSTPGSISKGYKNSGVWLLVTGIIICVINLFHIIPGVLLIVAGAIGLQGANKEERELLEEAL